MSMTQTPPSPTPFHLRGNYAPVETEWTATELEVRGTLPAELNGTYVRNGPNPRPGRPSPIWFLGQGMLHGVRLVGGRALWYRNRWIDAPSTSNTHVVRHAGRTLALVETAAPVEVDAELETIGPTDFGGALAHGMTAHPKTCPRTGELLFFAYTLDVPHLHYYRADRAGKVVQAEPIAVGAPTYMHDFAITEGHVLFFDLPLLYHGWRASNPIAWTPAYGARIGVLPREASGRDIRWFDVAPCTISHTVNAHEDGGRIVIDVVRGPHPGAPTTLWRYTIDLASGHVSEREIDPLYLEFPRIDDRRTGVRYRYAYALELRDVQNGAPGGSVLRKLDLTTGGSQVHTAGADCVCGEATFIPRHHCTEEDDGWAICFAYDRARDSGLLVVVDAADFEAPPVATVSLPARVPFGFHGNWFAGAP